MLDTQTAEHGSALRLLLAQGPHALGEARLLGKRACLHLCRLTERGERFAQTGLLGFDQLLRVHPAQVEDERFLAPDLGRRSPCSAAPARACRFRLSTCELSWPSDVVEAREIGLGGLEPQLGLVAAAVQAGDAGGILEDAAALFAAWR